jgi:hypothetical protein
MSPQGGLVAPRCVYDDPWLLLMIKAHLHHPLNRISPLQHVRGTRMPWSKRTGAADGEVNAKEREERRGQSGETTIEYGFLEFEKQASREIRIHEGHEEGRRVQKWLTFTRMTLCPFVLIRGPSFFLTIEMYPHFGRSAIPGTRYIEGVSGETGVKHPQWSHSGSLCVHFLLLVQKKMDEKKRTPESNPTGVDSSVHWFMRFQHSTKKQ